MSKIYKTCDGYEVDCSNDAVSVFSMRYGKDGVYIGQVQENMTDCGSIFIGATVIDGKPCVNGSPIAPLSAEEMASAK